MKPSKNKYKIKKLGDRRYALLKRKSRWSVLGYIALSLSTFGILNFVDWVMSLDGSTVGFMDFEMWSWEFLGVFESTEQAVEVKIKDEDLKRSQIVEEYFL